MTMRKRPLVNILSISTLLMVVTPTPTLAQEFLCDAVQASTTQLPLLDKSCPIGNGLWGKQKPKGQDSQFWIQCGIYPTPLSLNRAKRLYQHISTDVWMKPENKEYRCLIGPYVDFSQARSELAKVKKEQGYKDAFIREIRKPSSDKPSVQKPKAKPIVASTPKRTQTVFTAPVKEEVKPEPKPVVVEKKKTEVSVRVQTTIDGKEYKVPYVMFSDDLFYMEHELPWNRMSYDGANKTCRKLGMQLATAKDWKALLDSQVMTKGKWPIHLPYWGARNTGLFYNGKVKQLKGSSKLNVLCVK